MEDELDAVLTKIKSRKLPVTTKYLLKYGRQGNLMTLLRSCNVVYKQNIIEE